MEYLLGLLDLKGALLVALIFVPLERLLPARNDQRTFRHAWFNDTVYFLLNRIPVGIGLLLLAVAGSIIGSAFIPSGYRSMVAAQPLWLQAVLLLLIADLGFYAVHRLFHTIPALWRFHAIHHSIEELDWLAAHRVHPIDQILTKGVPFVPIFAFGFSGDSLAIFFILYQWHSLILHANLRIGFGPLHWVIASPYFHHWHHADLPEAWNKNFSGQLPIWDILFGTAYMRCDSLPPSYGIEDHIPVTYGGQLIYPFQRRSKDAA